MPIMAKDGPQAILRAGAVIILFLSPAALAGPPQDRDGLTSTLEAQKALQLGREMVLKGSYEAAVHVLEEKISKINGSREYLSVLREAYRGYVKELRLANKDAEADLYARRLLILDPGAAMDGATAKSAAAPPIKNETPKAKPLIRALGEKEAKPVDQFQRANAQHARSLLDEAEQEYAKERFLAACRLYEQAHKSDPAAMADSMERWGYCKLFTVVDRLNHRPDGGQALTDLEREVRVAMSLSPALDGAGQDLLRRIQQRRRGQEGGEKVGEERAAAVAVRHLDRPTNGWAVAETTNFRVYHNQPRELVERAAQVAEATRTEMLRKWFGEKDDAWPQKCDLFLCATAHEYARVGEAPATSPGHSAINVDGRVVTRRMFMHCDNPNMLIAVLPHETTHCVLAGKFGDKPVPRWADEGMAVLTEPREQIDRHLRNLPKHSQERQLFYLRDLVRLEEYPEPRRVGAFYAQSVSVVDFLTKQKGPQEFAKFLNDGMYGNYEDALRKHYGFQDFQEMEQHWRRFAFQSNNGTGVASRDP
jgi:hypothetical protein